MLAETQSQSRKWPKDPLVALANSNSLVDGIVEGLFVISGSTADFVSGVKRIGTFLFCLPVISMRSNLN